MESTQKQPPNCIEPIPCQWGANVGAVPSIEMRVAVQGCLLQLTLLSQLLQAIPSSQ